MTRYVLLVGLSAFGLGAVFYFYMHSKNRFFANHQEVSDFFSQARQADTSLEKDILNLQNFSVSNYDELTEQGIEIERICKMSNNLGWDKSSSDILIKYCEAQKARLVSVEGFKSKHAIYRNSLLFLNAKSSELTLIKATPVQDLVRKVTQAGLLYVAFPGEERRLMLEDQLLKVAETRLKSSKNEELEDVVTHVRTMLQAKTALDRLVRSIFNSEIESLLTSVHKDYFVKFNKERSASDNSRLFLFSCCLVFFVCMVVSMMGLWKSARELSYANNHLEERVQKRTKELMESQKLVTHQQEALMASSKLSALGEMAGGVAHEINTPLAIIQLYTDQLLEAVNNDTIERDYFVIALGSIESTVKRISKIILGLRSFARDGKDDPFLPTPLAEIVQDALSLCQERFRSNGIQVEVKCTGEPIINCRMTQISQVLLNLLNNSYDAIEKIPEKWIKIDISATFEQVTLSVTDSGFGIMPDVRDKIMQPFFTTKEIGKGTGLGLSISRGIVEAHGGQMVIDTYCMNTRFVITFPSKVQQLRGAV